MDEELRVALMQAAIQQKKAGASDEQINQALFRASKGRIINTGQLLPPREGPAPEPRRQGDTPGALATAGLSAADMALFGLGDELVGLVRGEEAGEEFRATRQRGREAHPIANIAGSAAGLLTPGAPARLATRGAIGASRRLGGLLASGATAGARRAGASPVVQAAARGVARPVGTTAGAAGVGAAEGGVLGATMADPGERAGGAAGGALLGGAFGGGLGLLGSAAGALRGGLRGGQGGAQRVGAALEEQAGLPSRRSLIETAQGQKRQGSSLIQAAERADVDPGLHADLTEVVRTDPTLRRLLSRSRSTEAKRISSKFRALEAGEDVVPEPVSIRMADTLRKQAQKTADAFRKGQPLGNRVIDQAEADEAQVALQSIEGLLNRIPGYRRGLDLTAQAGQAKRAFQTGRKLASSTTRADEAEDLFSGQAIFRGRGETPIQPFRSLEEQLSARRGMLEAVSNRIKPSGMKGFIQDMAEGGELSRKMRVIIGDEAKFQQFRQAVEQEGVNLTVERLSRLAAAFAGFKLLGSSIGGGLLSEFF